MAAGQPDIVRIKKADVRPRGFAHATIARGAPAPVTVLSENMHANVTQSTIFHGQIRIRAVVHHDDLDVRTVFSDRKHCAYKGLRPIPIGNDN